MAEWGVLTTHVHVVVVPVAVGVVVVVDHAHTRSSVAVVGPDVPLHHVHDDVVHLIPLQAPC